MPEASRELADRDCVPCRGGVPPLTREEIAPLLERLDGWECVRDHHLSKRYRVKDFRAAMDLVERIGGIAEAQGHHPNLGLGWGWVTAEIWTHKIDGLTESDFVLAAKCDRAAKGIAQSPSGSSSGSKGKGAGS
jgi:4a-hydroxytetrahydrobiopterin dehydratase